MVVIPSTLKLPVALIFPATSKVYDGNIVFIPTKPEPDTPVGLSKLLIGCPRPAHAIRQMESVLIPLLAVAIPITIRPIFDPSPRYVLIYLR
jgi:hypothetical protein